MPKPKKRSTRGKRHTELTEQEKQAHDDFWSQEAWQEVSEDDEIGSEDWGTSEAEDSEDSDIDEVDEAMVEEEAQKQAADEEKLLTKRSAKKTPLVKHKGLAAKKSKDKHKAQKAAPQQVKRSSSRFSARTTRSQASHSTEAPRSRHSKRLRKLNRSTGSENSEGSRKPLKKRRSSVGFSSKKSDGRSRQHQKPGKRFTQEEFLREAVRTENENKRQLVALLMMQAEEKGALKRKEKRRFSELHPRRMKQKSNKLGTTMSFTHENMIEYVKTGSRISNRGLAQLKKDGICVITGLKAKYKDPLTKLPYATLEAFRKIREEHALKNGAGSDAMKKVLKGA